MIAKKIKILIKSDGSYLDTTLPPITANEDGRTIVQVIAPFPITDIVSVNYSIRPIQATVKGSYLLPTGKFGKDVLDEDYTHFQTVADWNVFEIPINAVALEYISKYRAGLVLVSFTIKQLQTPYFATNYLGLFSDTNPIPTTTYNDGDYFIANEYNFTAHDITWAKGDYAYFYNGKWNKGKSVLKASTPSIELPVDPSLKDAPQLEYDEDVALLLANDLGLLTQRVSQSETDIESAENDINEIDGRVGVNETDIYNLESDVDDLETEIGNIKDGTLVVKKAEQDQLGNVINTTYETKAVVSGISTLISSLDLSKLNKEFTSLIEEVSLSLSDVFVVDKGSGARKVSLGTIASYLSTQELQLFTIVEKLPNENQNPNTIYLLTTENEEGQNQLLEYIWIANQERWKLIGSLEVDLSNYYTKTEANELFNNKVDKVEGKQLSTNDLTNKLKDDYDSAYAHSQIVNSNPHQTTYQQLLDKPKTIEQSGITNVYDKTEVSGLLSAKVDKNNAITAGTKAKITYDAKGLVTGGADLVESDIPPLAISKVTNLQSSLDNKVDKVSGKGLSTNDFTDALKNKLEDGTAGIDDEIISDTKVWSSAKTKTEIESVALLPSVIYISETEPSNPQEGAIWFKIGSPVVDIPVTDYLFRFDASRLNLEDGVKVDTWEDLSGNGNDLVQLAAANQPTFQQTGFNGKQTLLFNDSFMDKVGFSLDNTDRATLFWVGQFDAPTVSTNVLSIGSSANPRNYSIRLSGSAGVLGGYINNSPLGNSPINGNPLLFTSDWDGERTRAYTDGVLSETSTAAFTGNIGTHDTLRVGKALNNIEPLTGKISEIVYFSRGLTPEEIVQVNIFLMQKWGL